MSSIVISVDQVNKSYASLQAVSNLSFEVEEATCFGFLGPNGAGKTTGLKMLYGKSSRDVHAPGSIRVFGYDPCKNELEVKFLSGVVPQEDNLDLELTVFQNLLIYSRLYGMQRKKKLFLALSFCSILWN